MSRLLRLKSKSASSKKAEGKRGEVDTYGERLRKAVKLRNIKKSELAKAAGMTRQAIGQQLAGSSKRARPENLVAIARALRVDSTWLATGEGDMLPQKSGGGDSLEEIKLEPVYLLGEVEDGVYRRHIEHEPVEIIEQSIADARFVGAPRFALRMRGHQMRDVFPDDTILICVRYAEARAVPGDGDFVIVHRTRDGLTEAICRQLRIRGKGRYLVARTNDPNTESETILQADATIYARVIRSQRDH